MAVVEVGVSGRAAVIEKQVVVAVCDFGATLQAVLLRKSIVPKMALLMVAFPAVLVPVKFKWPLLLIVAFPAVLLALKETVSLLPLMMLALPAVLVLLKFRRPWLVMEVLAAVLAVI